MNKLILIRWVIILNCLCFSHQAYGGKIILPKPTCQYYVGTKFLDIEDKLTTKNHKELGGKGRVQIFYPAKNHTGTYPHLNKAIKTTTDEHVLSYAKPNASHINAKKFPVIILVPGLGENPQSYTILCSELASWGYIIIGIDLTFLPQFDIPNQVYFTDQNGIEQIPNDIALAQVYISQATAEVKRILPLIRKKPQLASYALPHFYSAVIGIKTGASTASMIAYDRDLPLVSILDPTGHIIMAEGGIDHHILFFNDFSSVNDQYYKNWTKGMNNQEWLEQIGKKPFYKQWAEERNMPFSHPPLDALYIKSMVEDNNPNQVFINCLSQITTWLNDKIN